jgi:hypothetical protein
MSSLNLIKPMAMAGCVLAGDKYLLGETDMNRSMYFAASAAAGIYAAELIAPMVPIEQYLPTGTFADAKTLEVRLLETGCAVGVGFLVNRYVLNNDRYVNIEQNKLYLLAGASFAAEYIDDYMTGRSLSYFV